MGFFEWTLILVASGAGLTVWRWALVRSRVRVGEKGILDPDLDLGWIRWDEIEGAYQPGVRDDDCLRLKLRMTERLSRRLRLRSEGNGADEPLPESIDVRLDLAGTEISPAELLQEIMVHGDAAAPPSPGIGLQRGA